MDFVHLLHQARSCRRFNESPALTAQDMAWLVDCARVAPCARNAQVLRYVSVSTPAACAEIFSWTHWGRAIPEGGGTPPAGQRPTGYIAILWPQDCSALVHIDAGIAAQTLQLAAKTRDWGCCMHASFDRSHCLRIFQVPQGMEIGLILALGQCNEACTIEPLPADGSYDYWRDAALGHHVPKRALGDILVQL